MREPLDFRRAGGWLGVSAQTGELEQDVPEEGRVVAEVAAPEAARILEEAMQPLEAGLFDP